MSKMFIKLDGAMEILPWIVAGGDAIRPLAFEDGYRTNRGLLAANFGLSHKVSEAIYKGDGAWGEGYGEHPLIRDTARRVIGYLDAHSVVETDIYLQRAREGIEHLIAVQRPDGQFIWWYGDMDKGTVGGGSSLYVTSIPAVALLRWNELHSDEASGRAADRACDYLCGVPNDDNANYNFFAVWALATACGMFDNGRYLDRAVEFALFSMKDQLRYGYWIGKNSLPWYHGIILRGLATLLSVMSPKHSDYWAIEDATVGALNHLRWRQMENGGYSEYPRSGKEVFGPHPVAGLAAVADKLGWPIEDSLHLAAKGSKPPQLRGAALMAAGGLLKVMEK